MQNEVTRSATYAFHATQLPSSNINTNHYYYVCKGMACFIPTNNRLTGSAKAYPNN